MGEHSEARRSHEKKIAKLKDDLAVLDKRISGETRLAAESAEKAAALAFDATGGNKKALSDQAALNTKKGEHLLQVQNLELLASPLRKEIAAAEAETPRFLLSEQIESVLGQIPELEALSKRLSEMIPPVAQAFGEFRKKIFAIVATSRPLLGDRANVDQLETGLRNAFSEGLRAELHRDFSEAGYLLFGSLKGASFEEVVRPKLNNLLVALESTLATQAGFASPGRAFFLAKTNVSNLLGMNLSAGQTVSLPIDDENVKKMVTRGAIEQIEKGVSA